MNKGIRFGLIFFLIIILVSACTDKKNLVGISGQEGPQPIETEITADMFTDFYSFEDSVRAYNSNNLLLGNYASNNFDNKAATLLKFTSLVDTFYEVTNARIFLRVNDNYNFDVIDNTNLKVGRIISSDWYETISTWIEPTDTTSWFTENEFSFADNEDIELLDGLDIELIDDSLSIYLPDELLEEWILADNINYGLALFTEDTDKFVEFYSSETDDDNMPRLYFDYRETEEDTLVTYYRVPTHDVMIYDSDADYQVFTDKLIASNVQPIKMFTKFDIPASIFTDVDSSAPSPADTLEFQLYKQRLTIARAELILAFECADPYPLDVSINLDPYIMVTGELNLTDPSIPMLDSEAYDDLYITSTSDSLTSDAFKINITRIMQNLVSNPDEYENFGIMIRSLYENRDFRHTEFSIQPSIEIIFVPPYLGE
ncbi:hypothetical protein ACFLYJ_02900 [Candidatus Cloacimonadota bacterium]